MSNTEFEGGAMGVVASIEFFWSNMANPAIIRADKKDKVWSLGWASPVWARIARYTGLSSKRACCCFCSPAQSTGAHGLLQTFLVKLIDKRRKKTGVRVMPKRVWLDWASERIFVQLL